jgi:hypothetical protein
MRNDCSNLVIKFEKFINHTLGFAIKGVQVVFKSVC